MVTGVTCVGCEFLCGCSGATSTEKGGTLRRISNVIRAHGTPDGQ